MKVPGILYSFLLGIATWATTYFATGGAGGDYIWAPILVTAVPVLLKFVTVAVEPEPEVIEGTARSVGGTVVASESKTRRVLLG